VASLPTLGLWGPGELAQRVFSHLGVPSRCWKSLEMLAQLDLAEELVPALTKTLDQPSSTPETASGLLSHVDELEKAVETGSQTALANAIVKVFEEGGGVGDGPVESDIGETPEAEINLPSITEEAAGVDARTNPLRSRSMSAPDLLAVACPDASPDACPTADAHRMPPPPPERTHEAPRPILHAVPVLFELLSASVGGAAGDVRKSCRWYDARSRSAMRRCARWLHLPWHKLVALEALLASEVFSSEPATVYRVGTQLDWQSPVASCSKHMTWLLTRPSPANQSSAPQSPQAPGASTSDQASVASGCPPRSATWQARLTPARVAKVGLAAVGGAVVFGISGSLAAPGIAMGLSSALGGLNLAAGSAGATAAAAASAAAASHTAAIGGAIGAAGAGLTGYKAKRLTGSVHEFSFVPLSRASSAAPKWMAVTVAVSGWLRDEGDFVTPWERLSRLKQEDEHLYGSDVYSLSWEPKELMQLGKAIKSFICKNIVKEALKAGIMQTALNGLLQAVAWPQTLVSLSDAIDNSWSVCVERSNKAGKLLAEVLMDCWHGDRPVTLVGYGLGARVIFKCLLELARLNHAGCVESAVLISAPVSERASEWTAARQVVAGRLVNVYSNRDWMLGAMYRVKAMQTGAAGLRAIAVPGVENCDVSRFLSQHWELPEALPELLEMLGLAS